MIKKNRRAADGDAAGAELHLALVDTAVSRSSNLVAMFA
jgi:hypothetical protein